MAQPSVVSSGTLTTDGTEQTLVEVSDTPGFYELVMDLNAFSSSDDGVIRVYDTVISGGTARVRLTTALSAGSQSPPIVSLGPVAATRYFKATFEQTVNSGDALPWEVRRL